MPNWLVALLGVCIGFILNEGTTFLKEKYKAKKLTDALKDELKTTLHQLEYKIDIANKMIEALIMRQFLPGWSVPFASTVYDHHFPSIINILKPIERDNVRHIHGQLKILDETTKTMENDFKEDTKSGVMNNTLEAYIKRVEDVQESYKILQGLIRCYLDNKPVDIYQRHNENT